MITFDTVHCIKWNLFCARTFSNSPSLRRPRNPLVYSILFTYLRIHPQYSYVILLRLSHLYRKTLPTYLYFFLPSKKKLRFTYYYVLLHRKLISWFESKIIFFSLVRQFFVFRFLIKHKLKLTCFSEIV